LNSGRDNIDLIPGVNILSIGIPSIKGVSFFSIGLISGVSFLSIGLKSFVILL
jgi:hypothetical protein